MTYPVKWFSSHDASGAAVAGAPVLSGAAGSLITVLDACLLTGYGTVSVASLTVSGGVATATVSAGHGLLDQQIALIAGATPGALNGEQRITRLSATQFSFPTSAGDGAASGAITAQVAPLGWSRPYSSGSKAVYQSAGSSGPLLRIDDNNAQYGLVRGYTAMSDVDSGTGPFPTVAQVSAGLMWRRSPNPNAAARNWILIGDSRAIYLLPIAASSDNARSGMFFGEIVSRVPGDSVAGAIIGGLSGAYGSYTIDNDDFQYVVAGTQRGHYIEGTYQQVLGSVAFSKRGAYSPAGGQIGASGPYAYPDAVVAGGIIMSPVTVEEGTTLRGWMPGLYQPLQTRPLADAAQVSGAVPGRVMAVALGYTIAAGYSQGLFDIHGPWR